MSRYGRQRVVKSFKVVAGTADDTDIDAIVIPANREMEVYKLRAYSITTSTQAGAEIELVDSSDAVLTSVAIDGGDGTLAENADTEPVVMPTSTSDDVVKFRTNLAATAADVVIECHYSYPGAD
jgi:hypothetical protein